MKYIFTIFTCLLMSVCYGQDITAEQLLDNTIKYHDPNGQWKDFKATLHINLEMPDKPNRLSIVTIDQTSDFFRLEEKREGQLIDRKLTNDECNTSLNGKSEFTEEEVTKYGLTCERTKKMKDYYTYLYGLPMKLRDDGTILDPKVTRKNFMDKEYFTLKVTYDQAVGTDTWYFYFDPQTYAMEVYQFYHDESKNDGEYILLSELEEFHNMKIPKIRKWYMNKDDRHLGNDVLSKIEKY